MKCLVVDAGLCNLGSIKRSLEICGADVVISDRPDNLTIADSVVLPGVGSFRDGMKQLNEYGWPQALKEAVLDSKIPLLGICLGMQLLSERGYEGGEETLGLGFLSGNVVRLQPTNDERVPHIGWNQVYKRGESRILQNIPTGTDFYFVHSYYLNASDEILTATTPYCGSFASVVEKENIFGVQFHPEKSSQAGFRLLETFLHF